MRRIVFIYIIIVITLMSGCVEQPETDHKAVDDYSKALKEAVGSEFFCFVCREDSNDGSLWYIFEIQKFDKSAIGNFIKAAQNALPHDGKKIAISVSYYIGGGHAGMFGIKNFSDEGILHDELDVITIKDTTDFKMAACDPNLYSEIEGIKELHVDGAIQELADAAGIDWYTYWPELERISYTYRISRRMEAAAIDSVIDSCNKVISVGSSHQTLVKVTVYDDGSGYELFDVSNYRAADKSYDGSTVLNVLEKKRLVNNQYSELWDPSMYSKIDGIKELHVSEDVLRYAEDEGIDWYAYWPDLEKIVAGK